MIWILNGLLYGFFTALYTLVNQKYKMNGYLLGIWRGFGIAAIFFPFTFLFPLPTSIYYWGLLIIQGWLIGFYDSHLFFATAQYGAGPTSRIMALTTLVTTVIWWLMTPHEFLKILQNGTVFITLILVIFGFTISYWWMLKDKITREISIYMAPVILALAFMSIITKDIAIHGSSTWSAITYYLTVSTFVSGIYNSYMYVIKEKLNLKNYFANVFSARTVRAGIYIVSFSAALITAKTLALRIAPNPGYVTALLLTAPFFVIIMNKYNKIPDDFSLKAGVFNILFLIALLMLVNGNYGIID